jgi:prepilin-type processing-associated H-X9-DG protein
MVELLAAVAIIAILASLLFPLVANMREKSQAAKCLSNLRQIGLGLAGYAADNDGYNPAMLDENNKNWDQAAIYPYLPPRLNANGTERQNLAFVCPSARFGSFGNSDLSRTYSSTESLIGKDANGNDDWQVRTKKINYAKLSATLMLFDGKQDGSNRYSRSVVSWNLVSGAGDLSANENASTTYVDYRHDKAFNGLFADGHAETIKRRNVANSVTASMWRGR